MSFGIPNDVSGGTAQQHAQASVFQADIDALVATLAGNGVYAGCAVTAQGSPDMTLAVAAGLMRYAEKSAVVAAGNVTITTADATNPRIDIVVLSSTGTKSVTAGTAAASPVAPAIPASSIIIAMVYVPANDTAIASDQIIDKRGFVSSSLPVVAYKAADETVNNSNTFQDDDDLKFAADASSIWEVDLTLLFTSGTTPDLKIQFTLPAGATMMWAPLGTRLGTGTTGTASTETYWNPNQTGAGSAAPALLTEASTLFLGGNGAINNGARLIAVVFLSSTAGTVQLQWAQNTANASDSKMLKGSNVVARRLGT